MNEYILKIINDELAHLPEIEKDYYDVKNRYYELEGQLLAEQMQDELYKMVERDYSAEDLAEALKNPNEW